MNGKRASLIVMDVFGIALGVHRLGLKSTILAEVVPEVLDSVMPASAQPTSLVSHFFG
jgi:hypothetical protein